MAPKAKGKSKARPASRVRSAATRPAQWSAALMDAVEQADLHEWRKKQEGKSPEKLQRKLAEVTADVSQYEERWEAAQAADAPTSPDATATLDRKLRRLYAQLEFLEERVQLSPSRGRDAAPDEPGDDVAYELNAPTVSPATTSQASAAPHRGRAGSSRSGICAIS
jgi:hypothetical protein